MKFFLLFVYMLSFISGCKSSITNNIYDNIAEICEFVVCGKNNNDTSSLMCGEREIDYKIDGRATSLIEFGVLTFNIVNYDKNCNWKYSLFVDVDKYEGDLQINPFDGSLVADIQKIIDKDATIIARVYSENYSQDFKLSSVDGNWKVYAKDVVKLLSDNYKERLEEFVFNKKFCGEVYIKIIDDGDENVSDYYWSVRVCSVDGKTFSAIISPVTGKILACS